MITPRFDGVAESINRPLDQLVLTLKNKEGNLEFLWWQKSFAGGRQGERRSDSVETRHGASPLLTGGSQPRFLYIFIERVNAWGQ